MKTILRSGLAVLLLAATAAADYRDDRDGRRRGPRVIIYEHADFQGDALVLYPGEAIENMSGATFENGHKLNDSVSSIWIEGDVEIFAYENARFRGETLRATGNLRDLSRRAVKNSVSVNWNDRISSLRVERLRGHGPDRGDDRDPRPGPGRPHVDPDKVIQAAFRDLLDREPTAGESREFRSRMIDQGWTEKILRDHLRDDRQYGTEIADAIVGRAYREVLGREPDPSGLKQFRWAVLEKQWTESDVRDALRRSDEYRNKQRN